LKTGYRRLKRKPVYTESSTPPEKGTPAWAKGVIYGALGYFLLPFDAIPDIAPVVGFTDDLGALAAAIATVAVYINDNVKSKAADRIETWFGK
jgi:uncharacterized membrane protein YkvA (DUF1232 family)